MTTKKTRPASWAKTERILNGFDGAESEPIARTRLRSYIKSTGRNSLDPDDALSDFEQDVDSALESWSHAPDGSQEKRAALLRLHACVTAALVVDELCRGPRECAKILKKMDDLGYL